MTAIIGLMAIRDVSLADAKQLVHHSAAFASNREERVVDIMGGDACCGHGIWMNPLTGGPLRYRPPGRFVAGLGFERLTGGSDQEAVMRSYQSSFRRYDIDARNPEHCAIAT